MKVLIVDDQPNVRLLLSSILQKHVGCAVHEATNGLEALDELGRQRFDLVILDVLMPLMDGLETLEALRSTPSLRHVPVVVLSAVRDESKVRQLVGHGIAAYLAKPLRPLDVAQRLQEILGRLAASSGQPSRSLAGVAPGARVLVVDGDPAFRRVAVEALPEYVVEQAPTGAEGLRACVERPPALVIVGQETGTVTPAVLMRKLRNLPELLPVRILAAVSGDARVPVDEADAVMQRSMVVERVRQQFVRLLVDVPADQHLLAARPELRPQMIAATEQVFGMMLGLNVVAVTAADTPVAGDDRAQVILHFPQEATDLEVSLTAARSVSERLTARSLQASSAVGDDDVSATLGELATMIASRLQTTLRQRADQVQLAPSVVAPISTDAPPAGLRVSFASAAQDVRLTVQLRAVPRTVASPVVPQGAPRTTRMDSPVPPSPVDAEVLEMLASLQEPGEPDLLVELVTLFLRDTPERLRELFAPGVDGAAAARVAHAVKGSAGNLGAMGLQELAHQLEQAGARGAGPDELSAAVAAVHQEYTRVEAHLRGILAARLPAGPGLH